VASGTSYNGWPANSDPAAIGVVQSLWFPGGVKVGDVTTVLRYVAEQFNARVEPIIGGWCWGYTYKANVNNPSSLSCHASGTALDINAPDHPNGSGGTFTDSQRGEIYAILDECQGAVSWLEGYDEMHFEIQVDAADLAAVAASLPAGGGPPPNTTDWFDMATKDELAAVIWEQINRPEHLESVARTVWQHMINDRGDAAAQLASASQNAEWAAGGIAAIPTDVWTKTITNETAADLLARAGAG
jgi:hypothetical protein